MVYLYNSLKTRYYTIITLHSRRHPGRREPVKEKMGSLTTRIKLPVSFCKSIFKFAEFENTTLLPFSFLFLPFPRGTRRAGEPCPYGGADG